MSKSNIKGNKNSFTISMLICLLVVALTLVSCFTTVTVKAVNQYKEEYYARSLYLASWAKPLTEKDIQKILEVDHVISVDDDSGIAQYNDFDISDISGDTEEVKKFKNKIKTKENRLSVISLKGKHTKKIIAGDSIEDSPVFSCIVPAMFYPFIADDDNPKYENLDYIDGTKLVGQTITVIGTTDMKGKNKIELTYNYLLGEPDEAGNMCGQKDVTLPALKFKLKIVGAYYNAPTSYCPYSALWVSDETNKLMTEMTLKEAGVDLSANDTDLAKWWSDSSLQDHYVVVDNYDNIPYVYNTLYEMGYDDINSTPEYEMLDSTELIANLFSTIGTFLIIAIGILSIIILIQSSITSIKTRKGDIGLMKAIGYKNRQIFAGLCHEQLSLTLRGFIIGGSFSALFVLVTNYIFSHKSFRDMLYIIDWSLFLTYLLIALAIAIIVPLLCQIILLKTLTKIQPREAMNTN
jgi:putative ABC transport system permease protein